MQKNNITKYKPFPQIDLPQREWPSRTITKAPIWCSVDLRDGNQALATPMSVERKLKMFQLLVELGFKEIEVGFPSASQIEFDFIRRLIEDKLVPDDVILQVLVQAREDLIRRTFESIRGARHVIVHLYNSTSPAQRKIVFGMEKPEIINIATRAAKWIQELIPTVPETKISMQYSPESFSATEMDFAVEICEAVMNVWQPTLESKVILNLPATVELCTPNIHADQIEWFCKQLKNRDRCIISLHTHNDRGTGIAATEMGLLAGADRVEGTLFGNGERTGNVDLVTLALNLYTQGVDPKLDFSSMNEVRAIYEECTLMEVPPRQAYGGDLVFTAFSGSHQDAINKGFKHQRAQAEGALWDVPYLPIDPQDIGRTYEAIIRINSQSGKGGVAYTLETEFGFCLPRTMAKEMGEIVNRFADRTGREITSREIFDIFQNEYLKLKAPLELASFKTSPFSDMTQQIECHAELLHDKKAITLHGKGNGPIDAFAEGLRKMNLLSFEIASFNEHSLGEGSNAQAAAYIEVKAGKRSACGAATDTNTQLAGIKALLCALNRCLKS